MKMMLLRPLDRSLRSPASILLAEAFYSNPAHVYVCPDLNKRHNQLRWMLGANLHIQLDLGARSFCKVDDRGLAAMGFWTRFDSPRASPARLVREGMLSAPFRLGLAGFRRMAEVSRGIDSHLESNLGDRRYWHLNNMVVREDLRGVGIGTQILEQEIARVEELEPGFSISLATQRPENVKFYQGLGFTECDSRIVGAGSASFRNWTMVRPPVVQQGDEVVDA